jgi:hypothetical protein
MPWFRATIVDKTGKTTHKEVYAGCESGARKKVLIGEGQVKNMMHNPSKIGIVVKDIVEIEPK